MPEMELGFPVRELDLMTFVMWALCFPLLLSRLCVIYHPLQVTAHTRVCV